MTDKLAQFDGSIPETYHSHLVPFLFDAFAEDIAARAAAAAPGRVLETAAGTGVVTRFLRDSLPADATITATDLNDAMLDVARAALDDRAGITYRQADAGALPFADGGFDAVVCQFGMMFVPDKLEGYREAHRVLSPGGVLAFNVWDSLANNPLPRITRDTMADFFDGNPPGFFNVPFGYNDVPAIEADIATAGFSDIEVTVLSKSRESPSARDIAYGLIHGNPSITEVRERGTVDPATIVDTLTESIIAEAGDAPMRTALQAIVFTARKA